MNRNAPLYGAFAAIFITVSLIGIARWVEVYTPTASPSHTTTDGHNVSVEAAGGEAS